MCIFLINPDNRDSTVFDVAKMISNNNLIEDI